MAKIKTLRLVESPHWAPGAEFHADPVKGVELWEEAGQAHVRFTGRHPLAARIGHVVFARWDHIVLDDTPEPPKVVKK